MDFISKDLEFLDLEDASKEEEDEIQGILFRGVTCVNLPWLPTTSHHYQHASPLYREEGEPRVSGGYSAGRQGRTAHVPVVPPPTSLHQVYQPQVVYLPPPPAQYYPPQQPPPQPPHQVVDVGVGRSSKCSPKRSGGAGGSACSTGEPAAAGVTSPVTSGGPYMNYPPGAAYHHTALVQPPPPPQPQYSYQHPAAPPLFLTSQIPVYPSPHHLPYPPPTYQQVFSSGVQSGGSSAASGARPPLQGTPPLQQQQGTAPPPHSCLPLLSAPTVQNSQETVGPPPGLTGRPGRDPDTEQRGAPSRDSAPPPPAPAVTVPRSTRPPDKTPKDKVSEERLCEEGASSQRSSPQPGAVAVPAGRTGRPGADVPPPHIMAVAMKSSQPPLNAIKTMSLPPLGSIKSSQPMPAPPPASPGAKGKSEGETEENGETSSRSWPAVGGVGGGGWKKQPETAVAGSSFWGEEETPVNPPPSSVPRAVDSSRNRPASTCTSWAALVKGKNSPLSTHSDSPAAVLSTIDSLQQKSGGVGGGAGGGVSGSGGKTVALSKKGPPSDSAVVLNPLSSSKSHHPLPSPSLPRDPALTRMAEVLSEFEAKESRGGSVVTPRGLNNPSNYCYINATLQALLACPPFYNLLRTLAQASPPPHPHPHSSTPVIDSMIQFVSEFGWTSSGGRLRKERWERAEARRDGGGVDRDPSVLPGQSFEPSYVYSMVHNSFSELSTSHRQEDAEEFLTVLLNGLNDEMTQLLKMRGVSLSNGEVTTNGDTHSHDSASDTSDWKEVNARGGSRITRRAEVVRTPVTDIFMGQMRSRVERPDPHLSTDNIQPFFSLPLDIESCRTVSEALARMTRAVECERGDGCQEDATTTTASYIDQFPLILILHLKCFHYSEGRLAKISKTLDYTVDLKIASRMVDCSKGKQSKGTGYKLLAVVYHEGKEATKGHYSADVFHVGSATWLRCDDALVRPVSEQQVLRPQPPRMPYLLLYRRLDSAPKQTRSQ